MGNVRVFEWFIGCYRSTTGKYRNSCTLDKGLVLGLLLENSRGRLFLLSCRYGDLISFDLKITPRGLEGKMDCRVDSSRTLKVMVLERVSWFFYDGTPVRKEHKKKEKKKKKE